jgi:NADH:ubiquinone reductase (non-electrogenic)
VDERVERICDKDEGDDASKKAVTEYVGLPTMKQSQKPRVVTVVVLGTGWGACRLLKELDTRIYDIVCISPCNHMVFTPLLASTCVGTLEFCSVAEPVRIIQPALAKEPDSYFFLAWCTDIDTSNHEVYCESIYDEATGTAGGDMFRVAYDKLVVATGVEATTFGIDGVYEHAIFLRDVKNAMDIHSKLMLNLMRCEIPGIDLEERKRLLHYVVVGGGPTGVEFSGELNDFIQHDVQLGVVKHVLPKKIILTDGSEVPYGLLVWSTGVGPSSFVKELNQFEKSKAGRMAPGTSPNSPWMAKSTGMPSSMPRW